MNPLKRPATEELLPLRARKAARRPYVTYPAQQVESGALLERWCALGTMGFELFKETYHALTKGWKNADDDTDTTPTRTTPPNPTHPTVSNMAPPPPPPPKRIISSKPSFKPHTQQPVAGPSQPPQRTKRSGPPPGRTSNGSDRSVPISAFNDTGAGGSKEKKDETRFYAGLPSPPMSSSAPSSRHSSDFLTASSLRSDLDAAFEKMENDLKRREGMQKFRGRKHIYHNEHKKKVAENVVQLHDEMDEMTTRLYKLKRASGYGGDYDEFKDWLSYSKKIAEVEAGRPLSPSRSFANLREPRSAESNRRHSDDLDFVRRALWRAKRTQETAPLPHIFTPSLDQLNVLRKSKDAEIDRRLRPELPTAMGEEDAAKVKALLCKRGVIASCGREQVNDRDISRLRPGQWLNDEIINFYGQMILSRSEGGKENAGKAVKGQRSPLNAHYFNTFFWTKLTQDGYQKARLAKWTKKIDIFSKDVILIPINHGNAHWTAATINFRKKRIEFYDSMGTCRDYVYQHLRDYLNSEHQDKKKKPFDFTGWENYWMDEIPQQENGYDCGVFTCQFLESLSRGEEVFAFQQRHMPYLRNRMILEIGHAKFLDHP
ncbi:hypothetical protein QCA50_001570 [Cerrena zonata]|uniref:Ubiquitin-like protease family profile domain-containing protein n=1 Tax=Cerrena zonata TaxID=2478898 RepID=A0AAW0GTL3_9APHY